VGYLVNDACLVHIGRAPRRLQSSYDDHFIRSIHPKRKESVPPIRSDQRGARMSLDLHLLADRNKEAVEQRVVDERRQPR
jgi:hypothetical protein